MVSFRLLICGRRHPVAVWLSGLLIVAGLMGIGSATPARAATGAEVDAAIQKAIEFLYTKQKDGNWEMAEHGPNAPKNALGVANGEQTGGPTALVTYALLAAGESPQDPRILQAIKFLENCKSDGIYAIGLRAQVWQFMPLPLKRDIREAIERDGDALLQAAHPDPALKEIPSAFYRYHLDSKDWDHSCSQYGVLGMWACAEQGYEVPTKYWEAVDAGWRAHQFKDGGWAYEARGDVKPNAAGVIPKAKATMTAAGIATLFITQEYLHGMDGIDCPGNIVDKNIEHGLNWMSQNFAEITDAASPYYGLYGIERIGVASGRKYFGTIDWYKQGSAYLVRHQGPTGNWGQMPGTAFALLFLVRGRAPVVMNKLQYELNMHGDTPKVANWNQRPRDAANVTKWIGKENERFLNWQIVNLKVPVDDLHDAPILYIAGNQALDFTDEEIAKLRQFVEEGGLIFANADCGALAFSQGVHRVGKTLFPAYEFRDLPNNSPIYTNEQFMRDKWPIRPQVEALSNGARELIILVPRADPARYWQTQTFAGHEELAGLIDDIFLYTVDRGEKGGVANKGETYVVRPNPGVTAATTINVARLEYPGNWDPEPGGWRRLRAIMHNTDKTDLAVTGVKLGDGKLDQSFKVADLTGTFKFSLPEDARNEIRKYVEGGGTLIMDSCGGDAECAQSIEKELAAIFPDAQLPAAPLPLNDPAYALGTKLTDVEYRSFARKILGRLHTPRIRGVQIKGRTAVFFSSEDLSCGMVGTLVDGIYGYSPASATALMEKLILFANAGGVANPAPASHPTVAVPAASTAPANRATATPPAATTTPVRQEAK